MDEDIMQRLTSLDPPVNVLLDEEANLPYEHPGGFTAYLQQSTTGFVVIYSPQLLESNGVHGTGLIQLDVIGPDKAKAVALSARVKAALHQHPSSNDFSSPYELISSNNTPIDDGGYKTTLTFQGQTRS